MIYRGQWLLGFAVMFFVVALVVAFTMPSLASTLVQLIWTLSWVMSIVCSLVFVALADRWWVPKWEREEKRTGRQPGDE